MSVRFDETNDSNSGDWITADHATKMKPTTTSGAFAFSVSLWVYFEADISSTETIWFYGDSGQLDRFLVLETFDDSGSRKLRARMSNDSGVGPTTANSVAVSKDAWHLVTVTATKDGDALVLLTLYLDAATAVTGNQTIGTTNEGDYNRFAIGRFAGSTSASPGSFLAEQAAIWDSALDSNDQAKMFSDNLNGEDVRRPPTIVTEAPDKGYWMLAGHRRHALRLHSSSQVEENGGDLHNGGSIADQPDMQLGSGSGEPVWSVKTPAVLYNDTATTGIPARKRKFATARHSPHFYWFAKPELYAPWTTAGKAGLHPVWDDPNMSVMARVPYDPANDDKYEPPQYNANDYHPTSYLTQIAKRVADWFEYQGFSDTTGTGGGGQYEGCVYIQALGSQNKTGTLGRDKQDSGAGLGIPLERHRRDDATAGIEPWHCWFRAKGEALVKEYSEEFWPLLKAEFDRRDLAYPKRLHWDYESSPNASFAVRGPPESNGTFPSHIIDDRAGSTQEYLVGTQTFTNIWDAAGNNPWNDYYPALTAYNSSNDDWRVWYLGWTRMIRQDALSTAIMTPATDSFPGTLWSNYNDFVADNSDYPNYVHHPRDAVVTPQSSIPADFSSPVLYPNRDISDLLDEDFGETEQSAQQELWHRTIEAGVNTSSPIPVAPWISGTGWDNQNQAAGEGYTMTREDLRFLLMRYWQRGTDEFLIWIDLSVASGEIDKTYEECKNLVNTITCMMNTNGSRTCRMGRTYRHCR